MARKQKIFKIVLNNGFIDHDATAEKGTFFQVASDEISVILKLFFELQKAPDAIRNRSL